MEKNYPKYLREWVKRKESSRKAQNMVAFLAVSADVKAALDVGYAVSTIWRNMRETGRIPFGYDTFLNYVNRLLRQPRAESGSSSPEPTPGAVPHTRRTRLKSKSEGMTAAAKPAKAPTPTGFTFNPIPKKEELL